MVKEKLSIQFDSPHLEDATLIDLYLGMLKPRMIEEKMLKLLRQGVISKWFSGIGQEAISVGATMALDVDETIFTMHRNLGVFTSREVPLHRLFSQWQGKSAGFTNGRDRSFHFGTKEFHIAGMISHLGPQLALAGGVALAHRLKGEKKVSLAFTGEGGTSEGDFHEALNVAAVWDLPVIFIIENNGYGLSTPTNEQYKCADLADRGKGYGMEAHIVDGNNIMEVYDTIRQLADEMRENPRPVLLECKTFRMRGHEEASGTKYVPKELMEAWAKKDPVANLEAYLLQKNLITEDQILQYRAAFKKEIEDHLHIANEENAIIPELTTEQADVHVDFDMEHENPGGEKTQMRFIDAIKDGLDHGMQRHENLVLMGQDIADYGGVFKITEGFVEKFGKDRVRNTPLCESAILGNALGLSMHGMKAMVEMQFADFVTCGFNQIVNNLAKIHYRWGQKADVVVRMPTGGGVAAGPFHSQSNEAWFFQTPGLKIAYPSNPIDAKGLLLTALQDPNPVMYFEHKALYRNLSDEVPTGYFTLPFGQANITRSGQSATIVTYGMGVHWANKLVDENNYDIEVIDLRTLAPLDFHTIEQSVKKTNRILVLHEDSMTGGIGGELSAMITENLFDYLDAPVVRCASLDTPIPFAAQLEKQYLANARLKEKLDYLLNY